MLKTGAIRDGRGIPAAKQPGANRQVQLVYKAKPEQLKIQHTASFAKEAFYIPVTAQAAKRLAKLRAELDRWMKAQNDPGGAVDTPEAIRASKEGRHLHGRPTTKSIR